MRYERIHLIRRFLLLLAKSRLLAPTRWGYWYWQRYSMKNAPLLRAKVYSKEEATNRGIRSKLSNPAGWYRYR